MITLTFIEKIFICFVCILIVFGFANIIYQPPKNDFVQPINSTNNLKEHINLKSEHLKENINSLEKK
ncbi:hypothetical protein [Paulownia witches'-broom phytoplasma]|uniref:hypothetical protein n=1 Tax=Paulownia witches'-broom phytoplasma TaxID=39647 RepID=UPI001CED1AA2|nr:hypothetical protein [Paulownia witches'-broom phytoplasma]GLH60991.1 hypothetical protein PAWBP_7290 [Paulownia witches'-broom phytoplasma]